MSYKSLTKVPVNVAKKITRHKWQITIFLAALLVIFLRQPSTFLHPQLWAEDGKAFFEVANQHHYSLTTLAMPYAGYFQLLPRAASLLGVFLPLQYIPFAFSYIAILIQVLPVVYLWSARFGETVKSPLAKTMITFFYLALPFTQELSGNLTNSQWYLTIIAFMVIFVAESRNTWVNIFDKGVLVLAGLTGPFSLLLAPVALVEWLANKQRQSLQRFLILAACAVLNAVNILFVQARGSAYLGMGLSRLFDIIGGQVFGTALLGTHSLHTLLAKAWITPVISILGIELLLYVFIKGPRALKLFIAFALLVLLAGMFFPTSSSSPLGLWSILMQEGATARYFFLLHIAIFVSLIWLLFSATPAHLKLASILLLSTAIIIGIPADFHYPPSLDLHFQKYAQRFDSLPKGQSERIPINPGPSWDITLIKN